MFHSLVFLQTNPIDSSLFRSLLYRHFLRLFPFYRDLKKWSTKLAGTSIEPFSDPIPFSHSLLPLSPFPFTTTILTTVLQQQHWKEKKRKEEKRQNKWLYLKKFGWPVNSRNRYHFLFFLFTDSGISVTCVNIPVSFVGKPFLIISVFLWYYLNIAKSKSLPLQNCLIDHYTVIPPVDSTVASNIFDPM